MMDKMITSLSQPMVPRFCSSQIASLSLAEYSITVVEAFMADAGPSILYLTR